MLGDARLTQANKYFVTKAVLRIPSCGPTHSQHGRLTEELGKRGVEGELPVCFSQNTPPLQAGLPLLKDRQHCHGHKDELDAKAIEVIWL